MLSRWSALERQEEAAGNGYNWWCRSATEDVRPNQRNRGSPARTRTLDPAKLSAQLHVQQRPSVQVWRSRNTSPGELSCAILCKLQGTSQGTRARMHVCGEDQTESCLLQTTVRHSKTPCLRRIQRFHGNPKCAWSLNDRFDHTKTSLELHVGVVASTCERRKMSSCGTKVRARAIL